MIKAVIFCSCHRIHKKCIKIHKFEPLLQIIALCRESLQIWLILPLMSQKRAESKKNILLSDLKPVSDHSDVFVLLWLRPWIHREFFYCELTTILSIFWPAKNYSLSNDTFSTHEEWLINELHWLSANNHDHLSNPAFISRFSLLAHKVTWGHHVRCCDKTDV